MLIEGCEMKKAYLNYKKYCEEEGYNAFRNKIFILRFGDVVNKLATAKNKTHYWYYIIKESFKNKYREINVEIDLDDITSDP
jgi:hypothetical protein